MVAFGARRAAPRTPAGAELVLEPLLPPGHALAVTEATATTAAEAETSGGRCRRRAAAASWAAAAWAAAAGRRRRHAVTAAACVAAGVCLVLRVFRVGSVAGRSACVGGPCGVEPIYLSADAWRLLNAELGHVHLRPPNITFLVPETIFNNAAGHPAEEGSISLRGIDCHNFSLGDFEVRLPEFIGTRAFLDIRVNRLHAGCRFHAAFHTSWVPNEHLEDLSAELSLTAALRLSFEPSVVGPQGLRLEKCELWPSLVRTACYAQRTQSDLCAIANSDASEHLLRALLNSTACSAAADSVRPPKGPLFQGLSRIRSILAAYAERERQRALRPRDLDNLYLDDMSVRYVVPNPRGTFKHILFVLTHFPHTLAHAMSMVGYMKDEADVEANVKDKISLGPFGHLKVVVKDVEVKGCLDVESARREAFGATTNRFMLTLDREAMNVEFHASLHWTVGSIVQAGLSSGSVQSTVLQVFVPVPGLKVDVTVVLAYDSAATCAALGPGQEPDPLNDIDGFFASVAYDKAARLHGLNMTRLRVDLQGLMTSVRKNDWNFRVTGLGDGVYWAVRGAMSSLAALSVPMIAETLSETVREEFNAGVPELVLEARQKMRRQRLVAASRVCVTDATTFRYVHELRWSLTVCDGHQAPRNMYSSACVDLGSLDGVVEGTAVWFAAQLRQAKLQGRSWWNGEQIYDPGLEYQKDAPTLKFRCWGGPAINGCDRCPECSE